LRLATLAAGGRDGTLIVVSKDNTRYLAGGAVAATMQDSLDRWNEVEASLRAISARVTNGEGEPLAGRRFAAPLPRAWQWLDGSAFPSHGELMEKMLGIEPVPRETPLMYQGMSHQFLSPTDDVPTPDEALGIDFEGEFAVIVDEVPMGISAADALSHIKLIAQVNDWSLRTLAGPEMKTGFGWVQAKPACSAAPVVITPDELGEDWSDGRVCLNLAVEWNGQRFGNAHGGAMGFGFHQLVAHAARTRCLCAGTIIGSGTVSNANFREIGSSCIAERRGIEVVDEGKARTPYMRFGDTVRMEARRADGRPLFGQIHQKVVKA
jgi:fumarylacetoacetate (FAA) hydrolase